MWVFLLSYAGVFAHVCPSAVVLSTVGFAPFTGTYLYVFGIGYVWYFITSRDLSLPRDCGRHYPTRNSYNTGYVPSLCPDTVTPVG